VVKTVYWIMVLRKGRRKKLGGKDTKGRDRPSSLEKDEIERKNKTDAELRKHREQKGLETPVVYAVNDVHSLSSQASG